MKKKNEINNLIDSILNESIGDMMYWDRFYNGLDTKTGYPRDLEQKVEAYRKSLIAQYKNEQKGSRKFKQSQTKPEKVERKKFYPDSKLKQFLSSSIREVKEYMMDNGPIEQDKEWLDATMDHVYQIIDETEWAKVSEKDIEETIWHLLGKMEEI